MSKLFWIFLIISIITILSALGIEYIFGAHPCHLCVYQRWPYLLIILSTIIGLFNCTWTRAAQIVIALSVVCNLILAGYHTGIERRFFAPTNACFTNSVIPADASIAEALEIINNTLPADCRYPAMRLLYLSPAEWNLALNIILLLLLFKYYRSKRS